MCSVQSSCVVYRMVSVTHKPFQNRNIEYCDFHFSRVLFSTKMAHLRRLGIHRFHFSITISFGCSFFVFLFCTLSSLIHAYRFEFHLHLFFIFSPYSFVDWWRCSIGRLHHCKLTWTHPDKIIIHTHTFHKCEFRSAHNFTRQSLKKIVYFRFCWTIRMVKRIKAFLQHNL